MRSEVVLTASGPDRIGIVEEVTKALLGLGGNVETSRMIRLGGEFAILMLVSLPDSSVPRLYDAFASLSSQGYAVTHTRTTPDPADLHEGWPTFRLSVEGADHEGIIHQIASGLAAQGIQIEAAETMTTPAAVSALPLFSMNATVLVPPTLDEVSWRTALAQAAQDVGVDVSVSATK